MIRKAAFLSLALSTACVNNVAEETFNVGNDQNLNQFGKLGGWSASAVINPPGAVTSGNSDPQGTTSQSLQATLDPPGVYTCQFEISSPEFLGEGNPKNIPVATIEWAVNGNTVRRKVSVLNGTCISGPGSSVRIKMFDESTDATAEPYTMSVSVTPGTRGGMVQPTLQNQDEQDIAASGAAFFDIPQDVGASTFRILVWNTTQVFDPNKISVAQNDGAANTISGFQNPIESQWVHVAPGAVQVQVTNLDVVGVACFIIFGIDG